MNYHQDNSVPMLGEIFVFGSNLSGLHLGGAAQAAFKHHGAQWQVAIGRTGQSYAIPTMNADVSAPLPLAAICKSVSDFLQYAEKSPDKFFITRIGCGIAGHKDADVAPLFRDAPANCSLPDTWRSFIEPTPPPYPGSLIADCESLRDAATTIVKPRGLRSVAQDFNDAFGGGMREANCNGYYSRLARGGQ